MDYKKKLILNEFDRQKSKECTESLKNLQKAHKNDQVGLKILDQIGSYIAHNLVDKKDDSVRANKDLIELMKTSILKRGRVVLVENLFALKYPDQEDKRDENYNEIAVGLQVNTIRKDIPNFVWTYGIIKVPPMPGMKDYSVEKRYSCCVTERVNGVSFSTYGKNTTFFDRFLMYSQIWFALLYANKKTGFTHNDLHMGNALVVSLDKPITIEYPEVDIKTDKLIKIIDFGRSFTYSADKERRIIGRSIPGQTIRLKPNYFYDAYFILQRSCSDQLDDPEVDMFMKFFRIKPTGKLYDDMKIVGNNTYSMSKWIDLIFNCPSGKKLLKRKSATVEDVTDDQKYLPIPKAILPPDYTFDILKKYLEIKDRRDTQMVRNQIFIEEKRIARLISLRSLLKKKIHLPNTLRLINPNDHPETGQNKLLDDLEAIIRLSESVVLEKNLENAIEIYRQRLDFLNHWLIF